jgi:hypothetical protein
MSERDAHHIWMEQCEAARSIRARYGLAAAFNYLIGGKLLNFIHAASRHPDFARELPRFVSEVRRLFTAEEITAHISQIERPDAEEDLDLFDDEPLYAAATQERRRQIMLVKELLTANTLGTS